MVLVEGIAVSGEYVNNLKDKSFVVVKAPKYVEFPDFKEPTKTERKLLVALELLGTHEIMDYYPNKSSVKIMASLHGFEMDKWIGKKFEFEVIKQKVSGKDAFVLYVAAKKL